MAIAFNAATSFGDGAITTISTAAHTASGSDRLLIAALYVEGGTPGVGVTGVTMSYGATSMGSPLVISSDGDSGFVRLYTMVAPVTSAQVPTAAWTENGSRVGLAVVSYTGVDQSTPTRDTDNTWIEAASISRTLTSIVGDLCVDVGVNALTTITVGAGQTRRVTLDDLAGSVRSLGISEKAGAAGTTSMSWTSGSDTYMYQAAITLIASGGGGGGGSTVMKKFRRYL
jgi:hypothetical protein